MDSETEKKRFLVNFHLSKSVVVGLVILLLVPWIFLAWFALHHVRETSGDGKTDDTGRASMPQHEVESGPWGVLDIERITLDIPSQYTDFDFSAETHAKWVFKNATVENVRQTFVKAGIDASSVESLTKAAVEDPAIKGFNIRPPDDVVRGMSLQVRTALYAELAREPDNIAQTEPFRFRGASVHEWFVKSDLSPQTIATIEPLIYKRANYLLFSDPQLVLPGIESRMERIKLFKALHRTSTLRVRIRAQEGGNTTGILDYWGRRNRIGEIEPLITVLSTQADGMSIISFLPVFARTRLYTYVSPTENADGLKRDCHWASFNFFNDPPDNRFAVWGSVQQIVPSEYEAVNSPSQLGDVILFFHGEQLIHSCVYIADDIVFTKNGLGTAVPFILEKLDDVAAYYREQSGSVRLAFCRRK